MKRPEFPLTTFSYAVEILQDYAAWELQLPREDMKNLREVLGRTNALLADIGLSPDRKYSVDEVSRLQTAVIWALGGE